VLGPKKQTNKAIKNFLKLSVIIIYRSIVVFLFYIIQGALYPYIETIRMNIEATLFYYDIRCVTSPMSY
jgi:hypothetical protein